MPELQPDGSQLVPLTVRVDCPWGDTHIAAVVYSRRLRDGFRRRWWVRCWECPMRLGPFGSPMEARNCQRDVETIGSVRTVLKMEGIESRDAGHG